MSKSLEGKVAVITGSGQGRLEVNGEGNPLGRLADPREIGRAAPAHSPRTALNR
jgi:hypothetical protein